MVFTYLVKAFSEIIAPPPYLGGLLMPIFILRLHDFCAHVNAFALKGHTKCSCTCINKFIDQCQLYG